ncbi:MAG: hypothetical protein KF821_01830 [Anaerolineales bacterium]|jgi:hypothetical protein|nr:hypothetical protein [Anaerolineales bacterium]MBX3004549.1 hypothetical protein [Anaerolineales bacterium]
MPGVNYVASGSEDKEVVFTATGKPQVLGWVQVSNAGLGEALVGIYIAGSSATHVLIPPKAFDPGESFPFPCAPTLNIGDEIQVDCDQAGVTFHFSLAESK